MILNPDALKIFCRIEHNISFGQYSIQQLQGQMYLYVHINNGSGHLQIASTFHINYSGKCSVRLTHLRKEVQVNLFLDSQC